MKVLRFAVLVLLAIRCSAGSNGDGPPTPSTTDDPAMSRASLVAALRSAGLDVRDAGSVEQPFFTVPAHVYVVSGSDLQVYEFASAAEAEEAASRVAPDGGSIGTTMVSWMAPPHFFRKDRLLANYLGTSEKTLAELRRLFGPQFAGR